VSHSDDRLHAALIAYQASETLREALAAANHPDVCAGQIWRAHIHGTSLMVLIVGDFVTGSGDVVVATPGESPPADSSVDHRRVTTDVFRSLTLWPTVRGTLHHRVLDVMVEHSATSTALADQLHPPLRVVLDEDALDPGGELLAELRDDLARVQAAPAVPRRTEDTGRHALRLPGTAREQLEQLIEHLGVNQHEAMELHRGRRPLTPEQASALEAAVGLEPGTLLSSAGIDPDLALEVEHPRWRDATRRRAARTGQDEVAARISLAAEAYALAARESTADPDWRQRIALLVAGEP
jgi:plasmid maintenance system antidote protein VapI